MDYLIYIGILLLMCRQVVSLRCYQCYSPRDKGCWRFNLNNIYLKECGAHPNGTSPVCRALTQVHYFTSSQDVTVIRECAYVYETPLRCVQSKFSSLHYSLSCECDADGCNTGSSVYSRWNVFFVLLNACINFKEIY